MPRHILLLQPKEFLIFPEQRQYTVSVSGSSQPLSERRLWSSGRNKWRLSRAGFPVIIILVKEEARLYGRVRMVSLFFSWSIRMTLLVPAVAAVMYLGIILFPQKKSWFSLSAAFILIVTGLAPLREALLHYINWNILLIYLGSLVLAELFIYSRVPAYLAEKIIDKSSTLGAAIVIILLMTGFISAFVENVATVLVMAPIMLELSRKLKKSPAPFMIGLAIMANLQGTATLVGDPPSMIFANYAGYSFNDFFFTQGKMSIFFFVQAGALAGALYFYAIFRNLDRERVSVPEERIQSWIPTLLLLLMIVGLGIISGFSSGGIHLASGLLCTALAIIGLVWLRFFMHESHETVKKMLVGLDWDTMAFLAGIFIVIGSITATGALDEAARWLSGIIGGRIALGYIIIIAFSVVVSGFVDNVPYIVAMLPVAAGLAKAMQVKPELFMFGLLIGSCMGGNLTPFGASANVVATGLSKKAGSKVSFFSWLKLAGPFTLITTVVSALVTYLVWK